MVSRSHVCVCVWSPHWDVSSSHCAFVFPHAVLLTEKLDARIADLGLATFVQDDGGSTRRTQTHTHGGGTRGYEAPEVANLKFSSKADMFSASVMFYEMATGKLPDMQSINSDTMFDPLKNDPQTLELLKFMLKMDSAERPTAKDLNSKISTLTTFIEQTDEVDSGGALLGRELKPVEKAVLASARRLATEGTGENAPAHGLCFVAGDAAKLMEFDEDGDGVIGTIGKPQFNYLKLGPNTVPDWQAPTRTKTQKRIGRPSGSRRWRVYGGELIVRTSAVLKSQG